MSRGQYILRRLAQMIPVVIGITIIVFLMLRLLPGDPAVAILGERATDDAVEAMRHKLGLNRPIWVQYGIYMRDLVQLDLGDSTKYNVPVNDLIWKRLEVTIFLVLYTGIVTSIIAVPLGVLAALKKDSLLDNIVRSLLMVTLVMPSFWVGIMFIIFFSIKLNLFPVSGYGDGFVAHIHHLFLPALTLSLGLAPILIRSLRSSILDVLRADYVKTARAKGLSEQVVVTAHVLRNALIPTVTLLGISLGFLMSGAVITERVYALPGAGNLLIDAISARDYPTVQATTMIFAVLVILTNLVTDIVYSFLDPRVRYS